MRMPDAEEVALSALLVRLRLAVQVCLWGSLILVPVMLALDCARNTVLCTALILLVVLAGLCWYRHRVHQQLHTIHERQS